MAEQKQYHAWYSEKQAEIAGTVFYRKADGSGEAELTQVVQILNKDEKPEKSNDWDDTVYLGIVDKYLRQGRENPNKNF